MKSRILLIDESLTVQKVVSLTLDKDSYDLAFAKNRREAITEIKERTPQLILLSDQMKELKASHFPKEVEAWLGRDHELPKSVLITSQNISEMKHYVAVLKKPFTPGALEEVVSQHTTAISGTKGIDAALGSSTDDWQEESTVKGIAPLAKNESSNLWDAPKPPLIGAEDSAAYKSVLENQVLSQLESRDLDAIVDKLLSKLVPPIVERLVQEKLDKLMREQELTMES